MGKNEYIEYNISIIFIQYPMVGKTHEVGGLVALIGTDILVKGAVVNVPTAYFATAAVLLGALTPDLDKPGSYIYKYIPLGSIVGKIIRPVFIGGHRHISHSIIGLAIFGYLSEWLISYIPNNIGLDLKLIWVTYMIGILSHLILDALTIEGIPLFFPFHFKFGFPPWPHTRIKTDGLIERLIIFPGLVVSIILLYSDYYYIFIR